MKHTDYLEQAKSTGASLYAQYREECGENIRHWTYQTWLEAEVLRLREEEQDLQDVIDAQKRELETKKKRKKSP